jgi:hypothetical protein
LAAAVALTLIFGGGAAHADGVAGDHGIRPYLGVTSHLDVDSQITALGGTKFLFGADYLFGGSTGLLFVAGFRVGAGGEAVMFQPLFELHYRWSSLYPLVPWVGGGASVRAAQARADGFNFGVFGRVVAGVEYFAADSFAIGAQFALPDLGARLIPSTAAVGTIEVIIGPHIRF